jgi:hypothetical protein
MTATVDGFWRKNERLGSGEVILDAARIAELKALGYL